MSTLEVPGARLYYETRGSGPLLLMVPGANGDAAGFEAVAEHLAAHCTVVTYDRRGFSRSRLDGPQDDDHRLETDADDVRRLIERVSDAPATLYGSSSGGIVALTVLTRHPAVVRTLVPFEPPAMRVLPDGQKWLDFFFGIYDRYRDYGIEPALKEFREQLFPESDRQAMARAREAKRGEYARANATYWLEHELRQYPAVALDLDALKAHAGRIVPAAGRESRGYPCHEVSRELGKQLGRGVIDLPGGHVGHVTQPAEFATSFARALAPGACPREDILGRRASEGYPSSLSKAKACLRIIMRSRILRARGWVEALSPPVFAQMSIGVLEAEVDRAPLVIARADSARQGRGAGGAAAVTIPRARKAMLGPVPAAAMPSAGDRLS